ncbi:PREDICTED: uncharacterized protein LOC105970518 [Erythranthe guttata]|uniref:uncharacterized protein LOC105970518 n=1 Tax=Erythranthe guttata TaxID=4155 RepID=UPI00064E01D2|nr:PREDICTED: uncharacterized protein LOC105970518 [Erythranthe guttata]|eukprot:XP_012850808.1 PREDICTED: uncharacterized protein LOC105970518 [Erythranthe guttata]
MSTASATNTSSLPIFNPSSSINVTKLTRTNYPIWKAQMLPYLKGQEVFGYVDGTIKAPPATLTVNGTSTPNPEFALWTKQDNLILSTINSSLTEEVLAQVYQSETSHAIWLALQTCFASQSRAKVVQVRSQLATSRKGHLSATDYFVQIKKLADQLSMAGQALTSDDIITYILAGLGPEYDPLVNTIVGRESITLEEVYSMLLTTEARILHNNQPLSALSVASVNVAARSFDPPRGRGRGFSNGPLSRGNQSYRGGYNNSRGGYSASNHHSFNRNNSGVVQRSNLWCQLCEKHGHTVHKCYHRFDVTFQSSYKPKGPSAMLASASPTTDSVWHPDTGATHHMTPDMNKLTLRSEDYQGSDEIQVGNGAGLLGEHPT